MSTPKTDIIAGRIARLGTETAFVGGKRKYMRLAYSGISADLIREGLGRFEEWER